MLYRKEYRDSTLTIAAPGAVTPRQAPPRRRPAVGAESPVRWARMRWARIRWPRMRWAWKRSNPVQGTSLLYASLLCASIAALLLAAPAAAVINGGCVDDVTFGNSNQSNNCTANDLTFVAVGLGVQDDGCVSTTDTVSIFLRAVIQNTTAQTRYDVGMYFATDGDPNGDGALRGSCAREILKPASANVGATACPPLDLSSGSGPFYNDEGDACSDLIAQGNNAGCDVDGDGLRDPATFDLVEAVTFSCRDVELTPTGFVNLPLCSTWGNNNNQVSTDGNVTCDSELEAVPGTKAKCRCEDLDTTIPAPELGLSCTCASPTTVRPGFPVDCSLTYTNSASCVPDASTEERFRCGTAGFVRFDVDDDRTGAEAGTFAVNDAGRGSTAGIPGEIQWTPASTPELTSGIVGPSETDTLDFRYTVSEDATDGAIDLTAQTIWSNDASFTDPRVQSLSATCDITVNATYAAISSFRAEAGEAATVESTAVQSTADGAAPAGTAPVTLIWETASEVGTRGFDLYRLDAAGEDGTGSWTKVNDHLLPAAAHLPGGRYELVDRGLPRSFRTGDIVTYEVVEEDETGQRQSHGPFRVEIGRAGQLSAGHPAPPEARRPTGSQTAPTPAGDPAVSFEVVGDSSSASGTSLDGFVASRRLPSPEDRRRLGEVSFEASSDAARQGRGATDGAPVRARVEVAGAGLVLLPAADLATAWGVSEAEARRTLDRGQVLLTGRGREIPWEATEGGLRFWAQGIDTLFTRTDVYFAQAGSRGPKMDAVRGGGRVPAAVEPGSFPFRLHAEEDVLHRPVVAQQPDQDYWFWRGILSGHPALGSASFVLEPAAVADDPGSPELTVHLWGQSSDPTGPDHRATVRLDGQLLGEITWEGLGPRQEVLAVPPGLIDDGPLEIEVLGLEGSFFVDGFDLTYRRRLEARDGQLLFPADGRRAVTIPGFESSEVGVYEILGPSQVRYLDDRRLRVDADPGGTWRVTFELPDPDAEYLAVDLASGAVLPASVRPDRPSDLRDPSLRADYLIVGPGELLGAAEELADLRRAAGLEVEIVDLEDVYDEMRHGLSDPEALRDFLETAWSTWELPPSMVVLLGKGSYDYRGLLPFGANLMPALMAPTRNGLVPSDASYAVFGDDPLPRMAVGRLPVASADELSALVDKLTAYEEGLGTWTGPALMLADNPDSAGSFPADADALASTLPDGLAVERIYLGQPLSLAESRQRTADGFRAGAPLLTYVGHGGFDRLAAEGILRTADVAALGNGDRLPLVTTLTCNIGMFAFPGFTSLGERLVIEPAGGASAVWGPVGLSLNGEANRLGRRLLPRLSAGQARAETLGEAILGALAEYLEQGGDPEMVRIYGLLGDPATALP